MASSTIIMYYLMLPMLNTNTGTYCQQRVLASHDFTTTHQFQSVRCSSLMDYSSASFQGPSVTRLKRGQGGLGCKSVLSAPLSGRYPTALRPQVTCTGAATSCSRSYASASPCCSYVEYTAEDDDQADGKNNYFFGFGWLAEQQPQFPEHCKEVTVRTEERQVRQVRPKA